jgi:chromosome partitioning protein
VAKIIVFANQKGGVGKTTSCVNIGAYLAISGQRVLLVDFDPQGNLSSSFGKSDQTPSIYEVISGGAPLSAAVQPTETKNLFVVTSNINLTGANVELVGVDNREHFLREALSVEASAWDYILIDCPPSLGILTVNGLAAAKYVMIPLQCEYFALEGLSQLLRTIQIVQKSINPELKIAGIFFTMYDSRTRLAREVVEEATSYFKDRVFRTIVPRNVRLSEAPSHSVPIVDYDPDCIGALSYRKLAEEVIDRV